MPWMVVAAVAWLLASLMSPDPSSLPIAASFHGQVVLTGDVIQGRFGPWALGRIEEGSVLVDFDEDPGSGRGDTLILSARVDHSPGVASGRIYGAVLHVTDIESVQQTDFIAHRAGRFIRETVVSRLQPFDDARALLAGFLIGDTSQIADPDVEAMRKSGLAHFVAVSGSNVALFLGMLAVIAGPLALGPRRRAILGLAALPVYAAATRFEPSVMRASFMAGIALAGRLAGVVLEAWQLLSLAVLALVTLDPGLTANVGFQLSVAATAGVLLGARWPVKTKMTRALAVSLGAQAAVAPLLLTHFGAVPLMSPVINLVAAPVVVISTILGAIGVAGLGFLITPGAWFAEVVLTLARGAAPWPQLAGWEFVAILAVLGLIARFRVIRPIVGSLAATLLAVWLVLPGAHPPDVGVVVLDVGQGDAILIHGGDGRYALVDGGPDEAVLIDKLRSYRIKTLELVVLTHVHADHASGLIGVADNFGIGQFWSDTEPHSTPASRRLAEVFGSRDIPTMTPTPGTRWRLGQLELVVEGPVRRYASPNDQSIVITVVGPSRTMLLSGDIETYAQADLSGLRADVLKVPHQGAATSDETWLRSVGARTAVVSVGPNDFGHPASSVLDVLAETGEVFRTDHDGDIVIDMLG